AGAIVDDRGGSFRHGLWGLDCRDVGDNRGKALTALVCTTPTVTTPFDPGYWWQLRLARISARDGQVLWTRPLTEPVHTLFKRNLERRYFNELENLVAPDVAVAVETWTGVPGGWGEELLGTDLAFPHDFADLDGDGALELVLAVPVPVPADKD